MIPRTPPGVLLLFALVLACARTVEAATPTERFLVAFHAGDYQTALAASERIPADDRLAPSYRAACLAMLGRSDEAVEAFRLTAAQAGAASDQILIFSHAQALHDARLYTRAQQELDALARRFPHSRLSERGRDLRERIERRLAAGLSPGNCDWYLDRGLAAYENARPALAAEFLDEYRLLSARAGLEAAPRALLALGAVCLELDEGSAALVHLAAVPPATEAHRGALFHGLALSLRGDLDQARRLLTTARDQSTDAGVRTRATAILTRLATTGAGH